MKEHENSKDKKITKGEKMKFIVMENRNDWDNYSMDACSLELYNEADVDKVKGIVFKDTRECVGYLPVFYFDDDGYIDFIIEYQGKQHYEASPKFGGKKGLYQ